MSNTQRMLGLRFNEAELIFQVDDGEWVWGADVFFTNVQIAREGRSLIPGIPNDKVNQDGVIAITSNGKTTRFGTQDRMLSCTVNFNNRQWSQWLIPVVVLP